jgi:hypothetical protein
MNRKELDFLLWKVGTIDVDKMTISKHLLNKMETELHCDFQRDILQVLIDKKYSLIEYNETITDSGIDNRVLLRANVSKPVLFTINGITKVTQGNICFVISLNSNRVVTAYWNEKTHNHDSNRGFNRYDANLDIMKENYL